jgi:uracil-DNA glycosylase
MYTALEKDFPAFRAPPNRSGLLIPWAQRGVLLLNACLTVRRGEANSHQGKGWERFTGRVLEEVVKRRDVVVMAWGSPAYDRVRGLGVEKKGGKLLRSVHPSPLSAYKGFVCSIPLPPLPALQGGAGRGSFFFWIGTDWGGVLV